MNERDTIGPECSATFREMDNTFVEVTRDAVVCPNCYTRIYPDSAEGASDVRVGFCLDDGVRWAAIEAKYGGRSRYPFKKLRKEQKEWLLGHTGTGLEGDGYLTFLWIGIGERIGGKDYPRKTWLIPFYEYLAIEEHFEGKRKSIPFDMVTMESYELEWEGGGIWSIPDDHIFWHELKN